MDYLVLRSSLSSILYVLNTKMNRLTCAFGHSNGFPVQKRAGSFSGREQLIKNKVIDHAHNWLLIECQSNGYGREWESKTGEGGRERERAVFTVGTATV